MENFCQKHKLNQNICFLPVGVAVKIKNFQKLSWEQKLPLWILFSLIAVPVPPILWHQSFLMLATPLTVKVATYPPCKTVIENNRVLILGRNHINFQRGRYTVNPQSRNRFTTVRSELNVYCLLYIVKTPPF